MTTPTTDRLASEILGRLDEKPDEVDIVDFSYSPRPIRLSAEGEIYECHPIIPLPNLQGLVKVIRDNAIDTSSPDAVEQTLQKLSLIFEKLMLPESAQRFNKRLLSTEHPLDIQKQVMPILHYVLERYGLRPTEQPSNSSLGSPGEITGITSTAGAPNTGSIH